MRFSELRHEYLDTFTIKERMSAVFGGFIFTFILFAPVFAALGEFLVIYFYLLHFIVVIMIFTAMLSVIVMAKLIKKALLLKKPEAISLFPINRYFLYPVAFFEVIVFLVGLSFLIFWIPKWLV